MSLSDELNRILDFMKGREIIKEDEVRKLMEKLNFDERLIDDLTREGLNLDDIIEEFLNQRIIWVDDESFQGDIIHLRELITGTLFSHGSKRCLE